MRRIEQLCSSVPDVRETVAAPLPQWSEQKRGSGIRSTGFCGYRLARALAEGSWADGCAFCGQDRGDRPDQSRRRPILTRPAASARRMASSSYSSGGGQGSASVIRWRRFMPSSPRPESPFDCGPFRYVSGRRKQARGDRSFCLHFQVRCLAPRAGRPRGRPFWCDMTARIRPAPRRSGRRWRRGNGCPRPAGSSSSAGTCCRPPSRRPRPRPALRPFGRLPAVPGRR